MVAKHWNWSRGDSNWQSAGCRPAQCSSCTLALWWRAAWKKKTITRWRCCIRPPCSRWENPLCLKHITVKRQDCFKQQNKHFPADVPAADVPVMRSLTRLQTEHLWGKADRLGFSYQWYFPRWNHSTQYTPLEKKNNTKISLNCERVRPSPGGCGGMGQ